MLLLDRSWKEKTKQEKREAFIIQAAYMHIYLYRERQVGVYAFLDRRTVLIRLYAMR